MRGSVFLALAGCTAAPKDGPWGDDPTLSDSGSTPPPLPEGPRGVLGGAARDGQYVGATGTTSGRVAWSRVLPTLPTYGLFPCPAGDRVFVSSAGDLLALDAADGETVWTFDPGGAASQTPIDVAPATADDRVYFLAIDPTGPATVHALEQATGTERWRAQLWRNPDNLGALDMAVVDDAVLVTLGDRLALLDRGTGTTRWQATADIVSLPVVVGGLVAVIERDGETYLSAYRLETGARAWTTADRVEGHLSGGDGVVYAQSASGNLIGVDTTGEIALSTTHDPAAPVAAPGDGHLYLLDEDQLFAIGTSDLETAWSKPIEVWSYLTGDDERLYGAGAARRRDTGRAVWRADDGGLVMVPGRDRVYSRGALNLFAYGP